MNHSYRNLAFAIGAFFVIAITSCRENTVIKANVLPIANSANETSIALPVYASTVYEDSINTDLNDGNAVYLGAGSFKEAFYGKTTASLYFQVVPAALTLDLTNATVDSAILIVPYSGFTFGNELSSSTQTYIAKRITDSFSVGTPYYPSQSFATSDIVSDTVTIQLGSTSGKGSLRDSVSVNGVNVAPHLRMRLNNKFTNLLLANYTDQNTFLSVFKGFCVTPLDTNVSIDGLPYFRLDGPDMYTEANVQFYYHLPNDTTHYSTSYIFTPSLCARANRVRHNYSGYPITNYFSMPSQVNNSVVVQNLPGAAIDLKIPGFKTIPTAIINKAELSIVCAKYDSACPPILNIKGIARSAQGTDSVYIVEDRFPTYSTSAFAILDGTPHVKNNTTTYILNIPREALNAVKAHKDTLHLRLNGTSSFFGAYRMTGASIKLNIVYSTLK